MEARPLQLTVFRMGDGGKTWKEALTPQFPNGEPRSVFC
jgi:hypothetical protein